LNRVHYRDSESRINGAKRLVYDGEDGPCVEVSELEG
jgi:hypothetical protein